MRQKKVWAGVERRASERIYDDSVLNVRGITRNGKPFFETTMINDVSSEGISFYLRSEIQVESQLDMEICSRENPGSAPSPLFSGRARALRVCSDGQEGHVFLVAARFLEPLSPLRELSGIEEFAEELRHAIELDEERRPLADRM